MYDIAHEITAAYNGLGDTPDVTADGSAAKNNSIDWTSVINTGLNVGGSVANTAINANHQQSNTGNYAGGDPSTYTPSTLNIGNNNNSNSNKKESTDYLPWILGGAALLLVVVMSNSKK